MTNTTLDINRLTTSIRNNPVFSTTLNQKNMTSRNQRDRDAGRRRALARSALLLSRDREKSWGPDDLDAHLFELISKTAGFYQSQCDLDDFRIDNEHIRWHDIPEHERAQFSHARELLTSFNHTLRKVIDLGATKFDFDELITFLVDIHIANGGNKSIEDFRHMAHSAVTGMRNELAVEKILIHSGISYQVGSEAQDIRGGDFMIAGKPIDVKTSKLTADKAKVVARNRNENPDDIVWSHIEFEDYDGKLVLPDNKYKDVARLLIPDIERTTGALTAR